MNRYLLVSELDHFGLSRGEIFSGAEYSMGGTDGREDSKFEVVEL
jgi:hypothetical protein